MGYKMDIVLAGMETLISLYISIRALEQSVAQLMSSNIKKIFFFCTVIFSNRLKISAKHVVNRSTVIQALFSIYRA